MTPRVLVSPMPGTTRYSSNSRAWTTRFCYWRWRCEACLEIGQHWTTADHAHDDGRAHATECAALKYAQVVERIQEIDAMRHVFDAAEALHQLARLT